MTVSHKKMNIIKEEISKVISNNEKTNDEKKDFLIEFLKNILKYDETKTYPYDKEKYEKYTKKYYEKNKEILNTKKAEYAKIRYHKKKIVNNETNLSIEKDLENIKI
jgi:hypothetical protein